MPFWDRYITRTPKDVERSASDDQAMVSALKLGDNAAFERLVRSYAPRLLATARRYLNNDHDAQDCLQDTFTAVHRSIGNFEERSSLGTWLHRIVVNAALTRIRTRDRKAEESLDDLGPEYDDYGFLIGSTKTPELTAEDLLLRDGTRSKVRDAISRLPVNYRTVLLLRDIEEYTTEETANALGINQGAVKTRLHRARTALKIILEPLFQEDEL